MWGSNIVEYAEYENLYDDIFEFAIITTPQTLITSDDSPPLRTTPEESHPDENMIMQQMESKGSASHNAAPNTALIAINFTTLVAQNADTVGWLHVPETKINYPVVQADDNSTYLNRSFQGKNAVCGTLFMDFRNHQDDRNLIIYGHNMGNSSTLMFSPLLKYKKESYFLDNPSFAYVTSGESGEYDIIAVCHVDIHTLETFNFLTQDFATEESFASYVQSLQSFSLYPITRDTCVSTKLITLVTCDRSKYGEDGRLIVVGMLTQTF